MITGLIPVLVVVSASQAMQPITIKTADMELGLLPRSPDQIISFYEARGFPKPMREVLRKQCFITTGISNHSEKKDLARSGELGVSPVWQTDKTLSP